MLLVPKLEHNMTKGFLAKQTTTTTSKENAIE